MGGCAVVMTPTVGAAVTDLGGWIFDRTAAGCGTIVATAVVEHARALKILGAETIPLAEALEFDEFATDIDIIATAAGMYESSPRVREAVWAHAARAAGRIYLWGSPPAEKDGLRHVVDRSHVVSVAGHAFKRQAQFAAGNVPGDRQATEMLWSASVRAGADSPVVEGARQVL